MNNVEQIDEKVEKRKKQLQPLFDKDKENYDLWIGKEQIFDTHPMSVNITGTEMTALSRRVQASLTRSRLDIHVLPPNKHPDDNAVETANDEERMYRYGFEMADERLSARGEATLLMSATWQAVVLGRIAVRVLVYRDKDGKVVWDLLPMIPSLVTFEFDNDGLAWYRYETFRSPSSILSEYGREVTEDTQGRGVSVSDYWDREHNVRYLTKSKEALSFQVGKKKVTSWEHEFGEVPAIIQPVTLGPKVITSEGIDVTAWGQGIFDHVKIPFKNLNKMRSIAATHAHILAKNPTEIIYEDGTEPNIEEEHFEFHAGSKIKHPKSVVFQPMKQNDIPTSHMAMMGDISTGIQKATYTELSPDIPGHSGSALKILRQDMQDVLSPRADSLNKIYTSICRMEKRQILKKKLTIPVRTVSDKDYAIYKMEPKLLNNEFYVGAEFIRQDAYDEVEILQEAQLYQQNRWMSRENIMEKMLKMQDVPAEIEKMDMDEVEAGVPELKLRRMIKRLQDRYDSLMEDGIEDRDLADTIEQMKEQLGMLEMQKQQSLMAGMGQPEGTPQGAPPPTGIPRPPPRGAP